MKVFGFKRIFLGIAFFISIQSVSFSQEINSAIGYIQYIDNQYRKIGEDMWSYTSAVAHGKSAKKVEARRKDLVNSTYIAKNNISKMPDFDHDGSLRDSMVSYLHLCYKILNEDYSAIINLEEIAEESYDMMEAYITAQEIANEKLDVAGKMLNAQSKAFAENHNVELVETVDNLSIKLDKANKAFKYYNGLYLVFFKCYKQEAYFMDAMQKGDVNSMEQNKDALLTLSVNGQKNLESVQAFQGDLSLKTACMNFLTFYQLEAKDKIPKIIDFFLKQENFEKIKKSFEANKNSQTKENIEAYNKSVVDYNKSGKSFNTVTQELNTRRNNQINAWNNTIQSFFVRHVPKN
jgi:hypothetical protein